MKDERETITIDAEYLKNLRKRPWGKRFPTRDRSICYGCKQSFVIGDLISYINTKKGKPYHVGRCEFLIFQDVFCDMEDLEKEGMDSISICAK